MHTNVSARWVRVASQRLNSLLFDFSEDLEVYLSCCPRTPTRQKTGEALTRAFGTIQLSLLSLKRLYPTSVCAGNHQGNFLLLSTHGNILIPRVQFKASELL
jgi:hypothetical protein